MKYEWNVILLTLALVTTISIGYLPRNVYYYESNEEGVEILTGFWMPPNKQHLLEEEIEETLTSLLDNRENRLTLIPEDVSVNYLLFMHGDLELEFSKDILNYGGTMWEEGMLDQILATVFEFKEVNEVTIKIQGNRSVFVEGTSINGYTREEWNERMCQLW